MTVEQITLRAVTAADEAFLLSVYASTRGEEMKLVPWTAEQKEAFVKMQYAAQKQHYQAMHPAANHAIICVGETQVGRVYVDRNAEELHILDITVLPEFRGRGAGQTVLRRLMHEAGADGKAVTIYVESFNPSLRLFERLGFQKEREEGFQLLLKRPAQPQQRAR
ncbi:MAG TPA: N-acetyltransferase [Candidatus Angelobacter sp.]|nr:N-acetyltransferase [Candidatus Angelobacter sp.]